MYGHSKKKADFVVSFSLRGGEERGGRLLKGKRASLVTLIQEKQKTNYTHFIRSAKEFRNNFIRTKRTSWRRTANFDFGRFFDDRQGFWRTLFWYPPFLQGFQFAAVLFVGGFINTLPFSWFSPFFPLLLWGGPYPENPRNWKKRWHNADVVYFEIPFLKTQSVSVSDRFIQ